MTMDRQRARRRRELRPPAGVTPTPVRYDMMHALVCSEHRQYGPLIACPVPGCDKGLPASVEWIQAPRLGPLSDQVYRRMEWNLSGSDRAWSWEWDRSGYLSIPRIFWSEAERRGLSSQRADQVFQYTSLEGFLGMLKSGELWLSDYAYLNDVAEVAHGLARAQDIFASVARERPASRAILMAQGAPDLSRHRVRVASFSTDADSLSQWRAYGPIAVGFRLTYSDFGYANTVRLGSVIYDPDAQDALLTLFARLNACAWERESRREQQRLRPLYAEGPDRLLDLVAFFKNHGFADEREVRMVHAENPRFSEEFALKLAPERFRVSNGLIVPYVTTKDIHDRHPETLPITEVVIGPGSQAEPLRAGVLRALQAHGYQVPVRISGVTYRS